MTELGGGKYHPKPRMASRWGSCKWAFIGKIHHVEKKHMINSSYVRSWNEDVQGCYLKGCCMDVGCRSYQFCYCPPITYSSGYYGILLGLLSEETEQDKETLLLYGIHE